MVRLDVLVWVFTAVSGFAMSVIFPELFSWTSSDVIHVCGKLSALFLVTASVSATVTALLAGYLTEYVTPLWMVYLNILFATVLLLNFGFVKVLTRRYFAIEKHHQLARCCATRSQH